MRIALLIAGSGELYYCENCSRDAYIVDGLQAAGHDVRVAPMYLPLKSLAEKETPEVFYGAVNLYLGQLMPAFAHAPRWIHRLLDSRLILNAAGALSGATNAPGLGKLTVAMLNGCHDEGIAPEYRRLKTWIAETRPDVVHLSNALLLGIVPAVHELGIPVTCALQDEHTWLDALDPESQAASWQLMREHAHDVDGFLPVSDYYRRFMSDRLKLADDSMRVVPVGIPIDSARLDRPTAHGAVGYMAHICEANGFDTLCEAFAQLHEEPRFGELRLRVTGGSTRADSRFIHHCLDGLRRKGLEPFVDFQHSFTRPERAAFLRSIDLLSVPTRVEEAIGVYLLEAMGAGVPVVQPDIGGTAELVRTTRGGLLYSPGTATELAKAIGDALSDNDRLVDLGRAGRRAIEEGYTMEHMVRRMVDAFTHAAERKSRV